MPAVYGEEFSFVSPLVKYLLFFFNMLFWVRFGGGGVRGHPDCRASLERRGGCPRLGGSAWAARCLGACRGVLPSFLSW